MAFAGFGAKPAATTGTGAGLFGSTSNTGTTNAFGGGTSLFGQQQQQQPQQQPNAGTGTAGGLFGSTNTNPTGGTGLFGQQQQQQPQQQQNAGGLFGQQQQQPQQQQNAGGLFGQQQQQPQQQQNPGGLFGQQQQQQPQQQQNPGGLFGQQQNNAGGGLFGQPQSQNTIGGGLFGSTATQQPQQQAGGGLFGANNSTTNTTGNSLFGNTGTTSNTGGGGLFGSTNTNQQNAGGGLFGNTNSAQQNATGGLFGSTTNTNTGGGLFGSTATNPLQPQGTQPSGAFGGTFGGSSLFNKQPSQMAGQQQQQGQQNQLGLTVNTQGNAPFTKSTKFNDLPENMRKVLENIDSFIQGRVQISKELHQRKLGEEPTKGQALIRDLHKELVDITNTIRNDAHLTQDLKEKVDQAVQDTIVAARIVDGFRNPQSGNTYLKDHASFPLEYFTRVTEQMSQRLAWYKSTIEQIERKLSTSSSQAQTPQAIVTTLQTQHATFLALASKTAAIDAEVQKIKAIYTQLWRSKTGSVRDPFNEAGKPSGPETGMEFSMSGLNLSVR